MFRRESTRRCGRYPGRFWDFKRCLPPPWGLPSAWSLRWCAALVRCIMGVAGDSDHRVRFVGCVGRAVLAGETSSRDGSLRNNRAES
jgi:hypothetical protein